MSRPWFLYLLECRNGSIYTGITVDVAARFAAHAAGRGARYTRANPPVRILAVEACDDHAAALRRECEIKRWSAVKKRAWAETQGLDELLS